MPEESTLRHILTSQVIIKVCLHELKFKPIQRRQPLESVTSTARGGSAFFVLVVVIVVNVVVLPAAPIGPVGLLRMLQGGIRGRRTAVVADVAKRVPKGDRSEPLLG